MSLLEKAIRGTSTSAAQPQPRTSLFSRATAAREVVPEPFDTRCFEELGRALDALPRNADSMLEAWSIVSERIPLAAIALFIPRDFQLALAGQLGFPSGTEDPIPQSLATPALDGVEPLESEARALVAPLLGVPLSLGLRATSMTSASGQLGLWVYYDPRLDAAKPEIRASLGELLRRAAGSLAPAPALQLAADPPRALLAAASKFRSASILVFDLSPLDGLAEARSRGLKPGAIRSAFLVASERMLAQGGSAFAFGEWSVGCVLVSSSTIDPLLSLFQFKKTLRRILPFLAGSSFPEGRAIGLEPSSESALEELSAFLNT
jgi:hypothetical protein